MYSGAEFLAGVIAGVVITRVVGRFRFHAPSDLEALSSLEKANKRRRSAFKIEGVVRKNPMGVDTSG